MGILAHDFYCLQFVNWLVMISFFTTKIMNTNSWLLFSCFIAHKKIALNKGSSATIYVIYESFCPKAHAKLFVLDPPYFVQTWQVS